jgi:hypothetical protein
MSLTGSWIYFEPIGTSESGKTTKHMVRNSDSHYYLGEIKWFGPWRRYAFFPISERVFEEDCLRDIADFCTKLTAGQRRKSLVQ